MNYGVVADFGDDDVYDFRLVCFLCGLVYGFGGISWLIHFSQFRCASLIFSIEYPSTTISPECLSASSGMWLFISRNFSIERINWFDAVAAVSMSFKFGSFGWGWQTPVEMGSTKD